MATKSDSKIVNLNVGGRIYTTTTDTLTKFPDSMLGGMFSGKFPTTRDDQGYHFIDANPSMFEYVLNYLRRNVLTLPEGFKDFRSLLAEAEFYQVQPMIQDIKHHMTSERSTEDVTSVLDEGEILLCVRDANHLSDKEWILKVFLRSRDHSGGDAFQEAEIERGLEYEKYVDILRGQGYGLKVGPRRFTAEEGEVPEIDVYMACMHLQGFLRPPSPGVFMGRLFSSFDRYEIWGRDKSER